MRGVTGDCWENSKHERVCINPDPEEGEKLAKEFGMPFWECSAKNNINVDESFIGIGRGVKDRLVAEGQGGPSKNTGGGVKINAGNRPANRKGCC